MKNRKIIFYRDDDVGRLTPRLRGGIDLLIADRAPYNGQVVPAFLVGRRGSYPGRRTPRKGQAEVSVGIVLHHEHCDRSEKLSVLKSSVQRLKAEPGMRFSTIDAIAARSRPAEGAQSA